MLKGKRILVGVTAGIAAYKTALIVRLLVKEGAEVKVVMTPLAKEFITPLTLATLSKNPILVDFFDPTNGNWNSHVDMGMWADAYLIAPATANSIGKMANGIADNLLLTTYLSAKCPVIIAPAMDLDMFLHPSTQKNIATLRSYGNHIIEPTSGELASGLDGKGRMEEPEVIVKFMSELFSEKKKLSGKSVLITAGPTFEKIDPVRFIGNYSSGKMGYAIANECAANGAQVTLISGPVSLSISHPNIKVIAIESALEMHAQATSVFSTSDIAILSAAVADYRPTTQADQKIKKTDENLRIELCKNPDIAKALGELKTNKQILVGFALETNNEVENANEKLTKKNLDFIVLNSLQDEAAGFKYDTNKVSFLFKDKTTKHFELKDKKLVAQDIVNEISNILSTKE